MHMQDENPDTTRIVRSDAEASSTAHGQAADAILDGNATLGQIETYLAWDRRAGHPRVVEAMLSQLVALARGR